MREVGRWQGRGELPWPRLAGDAAPPMLLPAPEDCVFEGDHADQFIVIGNYEMLPWTVPDDRHEIARLFDFYIDMGLRGKRMRTVVRELGLRYRVAGNPRRERELRAAGRSTQAQRSARIAFYGGRCWMCGASATALDHVKPLAKGGSHWPANLRPACGPCNSSKGAKWPYPAAA